MSARLSTIAATLAFAASATAALAADFQVGDRVHIGLNGKDGTVLAVGQKLMNGGTYIKVHVDGAAYPTDVGLMYDTAAAQVSVIGHGAPGGRMATGPARPAPGAVAGNNQPPGHVPVSVANCQQAIRANYITTGDDQSIRVTFLTFQNRGISAYESVYKGDKMLGAHGHVMPAMSIHAKYTVLLHFADPLADDQLRTYDANFRCYDTATSGELVAEMTDRLPGGEHATYIKKR